MGNKGEVVVDCSNHGRRFGCNGCGQLRQTMGGVSCHLSPDRRIIIGRHVSFATVERVWHGHILRPDQKELVDQAVARRVEPVVVSRLLLGEGGHQAVKQEANWRLVDAVKRPEDPSLKLKPRRVSPQTERQRSNQRLVKAAKKRQNPTRRFLRRIIRGK